jgi:hypothetical protein
MDPQAIARLKAAGFSDSDIAEYTQQQTAQSQGAGGTTATPQANVDPENPPSIPFDPSGAGTPSSAPPASDWRTSAMAGLHAAGGPAGAVGIAKDIGEAALVGGGIYKGNQIINTARHGIDTWAQRNATQAAQTEANTKLQYERMAERYARAAPPTPAPAAPIPQAAPTAPAPAPRPMPTPGAAPTGPVAPGGAPAPGIQPGAVAGQAEQGGQSFLQRIAQQYGSVLDKVKASSTAGMDATATSAESIATRALPFLRGATGIGMMTHMGGAGEGEDALVRKMIEDEALKKTMEQYRHIHHTLGR